MQIAFGRAGFSSYDLLDDLLEDLLEDLGRHSAEHTLPDRQDVAVGALAAPMASPADERNGVQVFGFEPDVWLGWATPGSTREIAEVPMMRESSDPGCPIRLDRGRMWLWNGARQALTASTRPATASIS